MRADEMDRLHEAGVKAFPAKTAGLGGQPLEFRREGEFKVFDLVAKKVQWEVSPGEFFEAWGYNGVVPGPEIRVTEGDRVRVVIKNELDESTSIHFHGQIVPIAMDGVPFIAQPPIKSGTNFTCEFSARPSGSHMYHSHHNATKQVGLGLLGAFIVEPKDPTTRPAFDKEYTLILNDGPQGFTINGKGFPATQPLVCKLGQQVADPLHERGATAPPDAPARHAAARHRQGRLSAAATLDVRHPHRLPRRALGRDRGRDRSRHVGLPLPRPVGRRVGARDVRHGDRAGRPAIGGGTQSAYPRGEGTGALARNEECSHGDRDQTPAATPADSRVIARVSARWPPP
jgi:hypothetical protein